MDSVLGLVRHGGNDGLFKAIEMSLLAAAAGLPLHLHAEGLRGTGKTTVMRAVRRLLPQIRRIKGCLYNCDPAHPHCPLHRGLTPEQVAAIGEERVAMPFLEISHSAKVGTVVGSIDLARLVSPTQPEAALLPGTIPQAHRGIIFVDEINRLAETSPELADILLDVMGTKPGRVQIEETGLPPVELPVQVTVWAASNPDEDPGPLEDVRRQLSDRFDLSIYTDRPGDVAAVEQILSQASLTSLRPPSGVDEARADLYRSQLLLRLASLRNAEVPPALRQQIADLYSRFSVESLRAVQAIYLALRLTACLSGRKEATLEDLARITPLALRHRVDPETMKRVAAHLAGLNPRSEAEAAAQAASSRLRFGGLSAGGAATLPPVPPAAPKAPPPPALDKPAVTPQSSVAAPGWDRPPDDPGMASADGNWLSRVLSRLRKGLGAAPPEPALRPMSGGSVQPGGFGLPGAYGLPGSGSGAGGAGRPGGPAGYTGGGTLNGRSSGAAGPASGSDALRSPDPAAGWNGTPPAPSGPGLVRGRSPLTARPEEAPSAGAASGAASGGAASGGDGGATQLSDPLRNPPLAPVHTARPLSALQPHEYIRTEGEFRPR